MTAVRHNNLFKVYAWKHKQNYFVTYFYGLGHYEFIYIYIVQNKQLDKKTKILQKNKNSKYFQNMVQTALNNIKYL